MNNLSISAFSYLASLDTALPNIDQFVPNKKPALVASSVFGF